MKINIDFSLIKFGCSYKVNPVRHCMEVWQRENPVWLGKTTNSSDAMHNLSDPMARMQNIMNGLSSQKASID
jgi:hypothetical protein